MQALWSICVINLSAPRFQTSVSVDREGRLPISNLICVLISFTVYCLGLCRVGFARLWWTCGSVISIYLCTYTFFNLFWKKRTDFSMNSWSKKYGFRNTLPHHLLCQSDYGMMVDHWLTDIGVIWLYVLHIYAPASSNAILLYWYGGKLNVESIKWWNWFAVGKDLSNVSHVGKDL